MNKHGSDVSGKEFQAGQWAAGVATGKGGKNRRVPEAVAEPGATQRQQSVQMPSSTGGQGRSRRHREEVTAVRASQYHQQDTELSKTADAKLSDLAPEDQSEREVSGSPAVPLYAFPSITTNKTQRARPAGQRSAHLQVWPIYLRVT